MRRSVPFLGFLRVPEVGSWGMGYPIPPLRGRTAPSPCSVWTFNPCPWLCLCDGFSLFIQLYLQLPLLPQSTIQQSCWELGDKDGGHSRASVGWLFLRPLCLHFGQACLLYKDHFPNPFICFEVPVPYPLSLRYHLKTLSPYYHTTRFGAKLCVYLKRPVSKLL